MLPIGVVIPTRNSMAYLPRHLETVSEWADSVESMIVVDSCSDDGTTDCFKTKLRHPNLQILSRPPGLYAAWNFGIQQVKSKYTYISTVGDSITREGLEEMVAAAEDTNSDVVLTPPRLIDTSGNDVNTAWPVQKLIDQLQIKESSVLPNDEVLRAALTSGQHSIMGSSASNLYRTESLQRIPFPTDYFRAGDMAWGIMSACTLKFAVVPKVFSTFLFHPKEEGDSSGLWQKMFQLARQTLDAMLQQSETVRRRSEFGELQKLFGRVEEQRQLERQLEACRNSKVPWILQPDAWKIRKDRRAIKQEIDSLRMKLKDFILIDLVPTG